MTRFATCLVSVLVILSGIRGLSAEELSRKILEKVRKASVEVHIGGQIRGGGAFVRDEKGKSYVLTAAHLFPNPRVTCFVRTDDEEAHFASLAAYDLGHDLAILEVDPAVKKYGSLTLAAEIPSETKAIFNFGPALHRRILVLPGAVADSRTSYTDFSKSKGYLAHYFASGINPVLTSGGIWVNARGELVGVQHGRLLGDQASVSSGLSMVSPPGAAADLLRTRRTARTPGLGGYVWETWNSDLALLEELPRRAEGLVVNAVFANRPLASAGIRKYDVILSCNGAAVRRRHELIKKIRSQPPGTKFRLEVLTPGSSTSRTVELVSDCLEEQW